MGYLFWARNSNLVQCMQTAEKGGSVLMHSLMNWPMVVTRTTSWRSNLSVTGSSLLIIGQIPHLGDFRCPWPLAKKFVPCSTNNKGKMVQIKYAEHFRHYFCRFVEYPLPRPGCQIISLNIDYCQNLGSYLMGRNLSLPESHLKNQESFWMMSPCKNVSFEKWTRVIASLTFMI